MESLSSILTSIILGVVQGLTEFLPVSSSGHLIIVRDLLGFRAEYELAFDAVLQLATTLAVVVYFWKDIKQLCISGLKFVIGKCTDRVERNLVLVVVIGTIPAIFAGLLLEGAMETVFRSTTLVAGTLVAGGVVMLFAEWVWKKRVSLDDLNKNRHPELVSGSNNVGVKQGLIIGLFQCLPLIPGMSRSGMTIAGGLFLGLTRECATRFSFLLAFPILLGSGLKKLMDLGSSGVLQAVGIDLLFGSLAAFFVGLLAIHILITFLKTHTLHVFVWYRFVLAGILLLFFI